MIVQEVDFVANKTTMLEDNTLHKTTNPLDDLTILHLLHNKYFSHNNGCKKKDKYSAQKNWLQHRLSVVDEKLFEVSFFTRKEKQITTYNHKQRHMKTVYEFKYWII